MIPNLITPGKNLGYKDIFLDFLAGKNPPKHFYLADNLERVAEILDRVTFDREKIAAILRKQNELYGASPKTMENIERLKNPRAVCVLAGQQAGLLGGPLFSIVKMLGILKSARLYEQKLKRPVIPVFWIAGDDHDFDEVNHMFLLNRASEPCEITYPTPPEKELPIAEIYFSDREELSRALDKTRECLGESDFTPELFDLIDRSYTPGDTFVTAFGKITAGLFRDFGLVLFSPGDPEVKRYAIPFFETILNRQDDLHDRIQNTNDAILKAGYHIQVEKKENATHFFYNHDGRKPVMRDGDRFTCGEKTVTRDELLNCLRETPQLFSPDVMTRPVLQSYLFPTLAQKGGPSEIAYLAQINPIFELFGLPAPCHQARPTLTVLEKRFEKQMDEYEISFDDLTGDIEQAVNRVLERSFPEKLENNYATLHKSVKDAFDEFKNTSLEFDASLKKFAEQIYGKIDYNLKAFESKVFAAHKKKSQETRDKIYRLRNAVCPNRGLQERSINITYFIARYGFGIIPFLYEKIDSEQKAHQIIKMSEFV
ncbi:MAG: bacillithiol biosynthesis cysteine-adding enzyme BshC [candidate division Zixibacteria bacterium]|nr:bacillithiol biosynthesis cysteine-adding enzyme BshC [candidate division Zixibacteria bacterium]